MSTSGERHLPSGRPDALALLAKPRPRGGREALIDFGVSARRILAGSGYPTPEADMRAASARAIDRAWYPPGFGRHTLAVLASPDRKALLEALSVPTLVFHGREDPLVPVAHGERVAALVPNAKLQMVDGMGHDLAPGVRGLLARAVADHARASAAD